MTHVSVEHVKREFSETLGYVRQDLRWLIESNSGLNYTIGLLIGCGCEMLAACDDPKTRLGEKVFAELLPVGDWQVLAARLYAALRDGLAHGFDTKHLLVDGVEHQIYLDSKGSQDLFIVKNGRGIGLHIGVRALADGLCGKIDEFENLLDHDQDCRQRFIAARQPSACLNAGESEAWRALVRAAGLHRI